MVTWISAYLLFLGKLVITGGCFAVSYAWLTNDCTYLYCNGVEGSNYVTSPILPSIIASLFGFFIGAVFLEVFDCTIESILISFLIDQEMNNIYAYESNIVRIGSKRFELSKDDYDDYLVIVAAKINDEVIDLNLLDQ